VKATTTPHQIRTPSNRSAPLPCTAAVATGLVGTTRCCSRDCLLVGDDANNVDSERVGTNELPIADDAVYLPNDDLIHNCGTQLVLDAIPV
jgi:hypothetical protein